MESRLLATLMLLAVLAALPVVANAANLYTESDGGVVAPGKPFLLHINMSTALAVAASSATPQYIVLNITVPSNFAVVAINVTYNDSAALPVQITWDPANRNITINVSVVNAAQNEYNDLNVTLIVVPLAAVTGKFNATYYHNASAVPTSNYEVIDEGQITVSVDGVSEPVKEYNSYTLNYETMVFTVAGDYSLGAIVQVLNDYELSWINETMLNRKIVVAVENATSSFTTSSVCLRVPPSITASFGSTSTSASLLGVALILPSVDVGCLYAPYDQAAGKVKGNFTVIVLDSQASQLDAAEVNTTYVVVRGATLTGPDRFNFTTLAVFEGIDATSGQLILNATASGAEAWILSGNLAGATLGLHNASGVNARIVMLFTNVTGATVQTDTYSGWSGVAYLTVGNVATSIIWYNDVDLVELLPYQYVYQATPAVFHVEFPTGPNAANQLIYYLVNLQFSRWVTEDLYITAFAGRIAVASSAVDEITAQLMVTVPSSMVQQASVSLTKTTPEVNAVILESSTGVYSASYLVSETATIELVTSANYPLAILLRAPVYSASVSIEGAGYGNESVVIEVDATPSILVLGQDYNLTLSGAPFKMLVAVANVTLPTGSVNTMIPRYFEVGANTNLTLTAFPEFPKTYDRIVYYVLAKVPNATGTYTLYAWFKHVKLNYAVVSPASATYTVTTPDTMNAVYISTPMATLLYTLLLNATGDTVATGSTYPSVSFNYIINRTALPAPGKLVLLTDVPSYYASFLAFNVSIPTSDNVFALIANTGTRTIWARYLNVSVPLSKVCMRNIELHAGLGIAVNSTTGWIGVLDIEGSSIQAQVSIDLNASTIYAYDSSFSTPTLKLAAEYNATYIQAGFDVTTLNVYRGNHYVLYSSLGNVASVNVAPGSELKVIMPLSVSPAVEPYVVETLGGVNVIALASTLVTGTTASLEAGGAAVSIEYTVAPTTPAVLTLARIVPGMLPPGNGYKTVVDVAVIGPAPARITVDIPLPAYVCTAYSPSQIIALTKLYFFNATSNSWEPVNASSVTLTPGRCAIRLEFTPTSKPSTANFTGLPVAIVAPPPKKLVGLTEIHPLIIGDEEAAMIAYAAAAAILLAVVLAATYARRR